MSKMALRAKAMDDGGMATTMRMTLPDEAAGSAMLATGMEHGMDASYIRLESMI